MDQFAEAPPKSLDAVIEDARLAALNSYRSLNAHDVAGLSRLSHATASTLGATHATVSFVDTNRVWFGGAFGFSRSETTRQNSFCDAVVRSSTPLLVPHGLVDPRFRQHEMVQGEPGLRSYAGAPLIDHGGYTLGSVAVYSTTPGVFAPAILQNLSSLALLVRDFLAESRAVPPADAPPAEPARPIQGWLGVKTLETRDGRAGKVPGLVVLSVARGSPAHDAGIRPTDVLHSIGGKELFVSTDIAASMAGVVGGWLRVRLRRIGGWQDVDVEIKPRRSRVSGRLSRR